MVNPSSLLPSPYFSNAGEAAGPIAHKIIGGSAYEYETTLVGGIVMDRASLLMKLTNLPAGCAFMGPPYYFMVLWPYYSMADMPLVVP